MVGDGLLDPVLPVIDVRVDAKGTILSAAELAISIAGDANEDVTFVRCLLAVFVKFGVSREAVPCPAWNEDAAATVPTTCVLVFTSGVLGHEMVRFW